MKALTSAPKQFRDILQTFLHEPNVANLKTTTRLLNYNTALREVKGLLLLQQPVITHWT